MIFSDQLVRSLKILFEGEKLILLKNRIKKRRSAMRTQLKEGEKLIIEVRKHWIVLSKPFIATACMIFVLQNLGKYNLLGLKETLHKAGLCGIIICALYLIYVWLDRKYDIWAVTNQRVIDESGVVTHKAKESPLEKINNIDVVQTLSGRLMGYGRVQIQTRGT